MRRFPAWLMQRHHELCRMPLLTTLTQRLSRKAHVNGCGLFDASRTSFDRPMVGWGRRNVPGHVLEWVEGDGKLLGSRMDQAALQRGNCKSLM